MRRLTMPEPTIPERAKTRECRTCGGSGMDALDLLQGAINKIVGRQILSDFKCRVCGGTGRIALRGEDAA